MGEGACFGISTWALPSPTGPFGDTVTRAGSIPLPWHIGMVPSPTEPPAGPSTQFSYFVPERSLGGLDLGNPCLPTENRFHPGSTPHIEEGVTEQLLGAGTP